MMDTAVVAILIAGSTLLLNLGIHIYGGGWNLSSKLSTMEQSLRVSINEAKNEIEDRQDRMTRDAGETASAIRQKIHEIETWARDEFVRKNSFELVLSRTERVMGEQFGKIDARLERMETKLDSKT